MSAALLELYGIKPFEESRSSSLPAAMAAMSVSQPGMSSSAGSSTSTVRFEQARPRVTFENQAAGKRRSRNFDDDDYKEESEVISQPPHCWHRELACG